MGLKHHFELLAAYNQHMNSKVYEAASHLIATDLAKERGAFFGSVLGSLPMCQHSCRLIISEDNHAPLLTGT
jgi:uncharacterized damage-inducible protein DinB